MNIDKQEIKALALACNPAKCADEADESRRLAEFCSELTPEVVLALLAEIEGLESRVSILQKYEDECLHLMREAEAERDQLKGENEALRSALGNLLVLYEEDEGCRNLPQYIAGVSAMAKEASHG